MPPNTIADTADRSRAATGLEAQDIAALIADTASDLHHSIAGNTTPATDLAVRAAVVVTAHTALRDALLRLGVSHEHTAGRTWTHIAAHHRGRNRAELLTMVAISYYCADDTLRAAMALTYAAAASRDDNSPLPNLANMLQAALRAGMPANRISRRAFRGRTTDKLSILNHHVEYTLSAPHGLLWHAPHVIHSIFFAATHLPLTIGRQSQDMTEIPEGPGNPPSEPNLQETTEPIPDVEAAGPASPTAESRSRWRWPAKTRNRIAASVAVAAGAAAIGAAVFTGGVAAGAHTAGHGEGHLQWGHYSAAAAQREGAPVEQIWIVPAGPGATGHDGFIITGTESASTASPG